VYTAEGNRIPTDGDGRHYTSWARRSYRMARDGPNERGEGPAHGRRAETGAGAEAPSLEGRGGLSSGGPAPAALRGARDSQG